METGLEMLQESTRAVEYAAAQDFTLGGPFAGPVELHAVTDPTRQTDGMATVDDVAGFAGAQHAPGGH